MRRPRARNLRGLPFNRMIPNILTMLALCAGVTSIHFGLESQWGNAVLAFFTAAILDGLDGRVARILKGTSKFGAELDSLSDFVSFGVAPPLVLYLWTMHNAGNIGWVLVLLFSVCCALRLARFNTALENPEKPAWAYNFFTGVPSPAGAGLVLLPMVLTFELGSGFFDEPAVVGVFMIAVAILMVSRVPTFAFKKFHVAPRWVLPLMLAFGLLAAGLVSAPWMTLATLGVIYLIGIPISIQTYRRMESQAAKLRARSGGEDTAADGGASVIRLETDGQSAKK
jgi:CDP-diacylglycerol--serine O-phosphatidyltransferase